MVAAGGLAAFTLELLKVLAIRLGWKEPSRGAVMFALAVVGGLVYTIFTTLAPVAFQETATNFVFAMIGTSTLIYNFFLRNL